MAGKEKAIISNGLSCVAPLFNERCKIMRWLSLLLLRN